MGCGAPLSADRQAPVARGRLGHAGGYAGIIAPLRCTSPQRAPHARGAHRPAPVRFPPSPLSARFLFSMSAGLNLAQLQAVHYTDGACLVLAGAGSGKTRVITMKIAHMIEKGMDPKRIAAITFTNKAAAEMRERAKGLIGRRAKEVL
eukprot:gene16307-20646_t